MTSRPRLVAILISVVTLAGATARFLPLFHDFWLDEIWSYLLVRDLVDTPADILFKLRIDNNHPLNSLVIYLLGTGRTWPIYRVPAWISGVSCIPMTYLVMLGFGRHQAFYAMSLVAFSYPLIVYSTEARGYAVMLFLLLVAVYFTQRFLSAPNWSACGMIWLAVILGFLSHLTFIHGYLALLVVSVYELYRRSKKTADALKGGLQVHCVPLLFLLAYFGSFVRHIRIGGSEPRGLITTLFEAITMVLGGPSTGSLVLVYVIGFVVVLVTALHRMKLRQNGWHLLFACGIVFVPVPLVTLSLISNPESATVFPRYFLTSILLYLLLTGFLLGDLHLEGGRWKILAFIVFATILGGNIVHAVRYTWIGRGEYLRALQYIVRESSSGPIQVASNSDFRTSQIVTFYTQYLPRDRPLDYRSQREGKRLATMVDWWIVELLVPKQRPPNELMVDKTRFSLDRYFDFYGPSGCGWAIYRRSVPRE